MLSRDEFIQFICPECGAGGADHKSKQPLCHKCPARMKPKLNPYDKENH